MKKIFLLLLLAALVLGMCSCNYIRKQKADQKALEQSELFSMGSVNERQPINTEYDVSQYKIPKDYDINSSDITVSESDLKAYAENQLQTIVNETPISIRGTYQDYRFLIIRRDCYDDWSALNHWGNIDYLNGYATIQYTNQIEFSKFETRILEMYKDPSDRFIIITNCYDYEIISEFFK